MKQLVYRYSKYTCCAYSSSSPSFPYDVRIPASLAMDPRSASLRFVSRAARRDRSGAAKSAAYPRAARAASARAVASASSARRDASLRDADSRTS